MAPSSIFFGSKTITSGVAVGAFLLADKGIFQTAATLRFVVTKREGCDQPTGAARAYTQPKYFFNARLSDDVLSCPLSKLFSCNVSNSIRAEFHIGILAPEVANRKW